MLFNKRLLQLSIDKFEFPNGEKRQKIDNIIKNWQIAFKEHDLSKAKETSLQGKFFAKFFCEILGYTMQDDGLEEWTLKQESKTEVDGKEADGSLGFYSKGSNKTNCVIELKDAECNLDVKQQSRESKLTPVEQAFQYSIKFADCNWVIVSNFRTTRIYHKSKGQTAYEEFNILSLNEEKEFKKFYFCLCSKNLLNKNGDSTMDILMKQSSESDIDITTKFYTEFQQVRKKLFAHICQFNPEINKIVLLEKTQKLLDRFIFMYFCEDTAELLPHDTVKNTYNLGKGSFSMSECRIWEQFRGLFNAIDKGNINVNPPITGYNGGLFAYDDILDKLIIKDDAFEDLKILSGYDFESDLNVNILGHIFEQSLSDLEQIKNEIEGIEPEKKSKRKKDGIFYTPEYITHYIVEQTVGRYLEEYPNKLKNIKILDPACGSGAFLNQAQEFLKKQYAVINDLNMLNSRKDQLNMFEHINIAENDRTILLNNIYGVDLNTSSVEITKLSLWLKTACKGYKLQNLDDNIKCGNSLVDDVNIAQEKAFNWQSTFSNIMSSGGFDIIIGNPPYVFTRTQGYEDELKSYYQKHMSDMGIIKQSKGNNIQTGKLNLFTWFITKSIELLKVGGILGFIVPNGILRTTTYELIRKFLLEKTKILQIVDLGAGIFNEATVSTVIIIVQKISPNDEPPLENEIEIISEIKDFKAQIYNKYTIKQQNFFDNISYTYNILADQNVSRISKHINTGTVPLGKICKYIIEGIVGSVERDVADEKLDERYKPFVVGKDIGRYQLKYKNKYIRYDVSLLHRARPEEIFINDKILIQRITGGSMPLRAYLDRDKYYAYASLNVLLLKDNSYSLGYILALLNSKLLNWYYANNFSNKSTLTVNISKTFLEKLPVKVATDEQQKSIALKTDKITELYKTLQKEVQNGLNTISTYNPSKITQALEKFHIIGLNPFIEELENVGIILSAQQREDISSWYKNKAKMLNDIERQIIDIDKSIDEDIFALYDLAQDEIKIIEENT